MALRDYVPGDFVVCESVAAIVPHLREIGGTPVSYSGYHPQPKALCGATVAWDTKLPLYAARCQGCINEYGKKLSGRQ